MHVMYYTFVFLFFPHFNKFPTIILNSAVEQMLVHFYVERMLFLRLCLREALKSIEGNTSDIPS